MWGYGYWILLGFTFMFIVSSIFKAVGLIRTKIGKTRSESISTGNVISGTPVSLLEVKVELPTKVIFGDEATSRKYIPSELVSQLPKLRLGEGTLGTLYKVVLDCGSIVTIRKIREGVADSDKFEFWIKFFGGLQDSYWLLPMKFSFWYGGEAFVLHEYLCLGSLEELLHGSEGIQFTPLSCKVRRQIALGAAKAVAYIHSQKTKNGNGLVCGVIKASSVLIRTDFYPCLSSYETAYLISAAAMIRRSPGRVAPELTHNRNSPKFFTQKSDIYSFGILLLELITGKKPSVTNLEDYVKEKRKREGLKGVSDKRMVDATENLADKLTSIAGMCLLHNPTERPSMNRVVQMLQDLQD